MSTDKENINTNTKSQDILIFSPSKIGFKQCSSTTESELQTKLQIAVQEKASAQKEASEARSELSRLKAKVKSWLKEKDIEINRLERAIQTKQNKINALEKDIVKVRGLFKTSRSVTPGESALRKENQRLKLRISKLRST